MTTDAGNSGRHQLARVHARGLRPVPRPRPSSRRRRAISPPGPIDAGGSTRVLELAAGTGIVTAGPGRGAARRRDHRHRPQPGDGHVRPPHVPGPTWRVADAQDLHFARRLLRPGGLPVRGDVPPRPDRRLPRGAPRAGAGRLLPLQRLGHPRDARRRERGHRRHGRGVPRGPARLRARGCRTGTPTRDRIRADVQAGGLQVEELDRVELVGRAPSAAVLAEGYCLGTPLRFELQERGDLADLVPPRRRPRWPGGSATVSSRAAWRRTSSARSRAAADLFESYGPSHLVVLGRLRRRRRGAACGRPVVRGPRGRAAARGRARRSATSCSV